MALKPCRECGKTVSTEALTCPQCGAVNPAGTLEKVAQSSLRKRKPNSFVRAIFIVAGVGVLISLFGQTPNSSPSSSSSTSPDKGATPIQSGKIGSCSADWHLCTDNADLVNNFSGYYTVKAGCETAAKNSARFGTPIFPWFSFGSFLKGSDYIKSGMITAVEPDAQYSNGFDAQVHMRVVCIYNLNRSEVVKATAEATR